MMFSHPTTIQQALVLLTIPFFALADGDNCIHLKGDEAYSWLAGGDFQGDGQVDNSTHCFGAGSGRISFGGPDAPKGSPGNTLLECHFPESETDADFYNCNLSLIDGWSAAVTCETTSGGWPNSNDDKAPLGCGYDLKPHCPPELWKEETQLCLNEKGAHVSGLGGQAEVFQMCGHSKDNPNSAEVFFDMVGAFKIAKTDFPLTCTVGAGVAAKLPEKRSVHGHAHGHGHEHHVRTLRARSVEDMVRR